MLPSTNMAPTPVIISEGQLPLGPVPRHTWIHEDTPPDSLDEACHEIWKRVQLLADRLHAPVLVPPLQHILCSELSVTFQKHRIDSLSSNYLLDEPEGLKSICKAMIGNREREMKLRALCNAQLSAKPMIPSLLCSVNSQKNSKGLEGGSVTGAHSVEGSKLELPFLLKHTDSAKGADNQVTAEETKEAKELTQNSTSSSASSSTTVSLTTTAQSQAPGQKQQLLPSAEICSKTDSDAVTKNPGIELGMVLEHQLGAMGKPKRKLKAVEKHVAGAGLASLHRLLDGDVLSKPCVRDRTNPLHSRILVLR